jgi:hypothetical protein
VFFIEDAGDDAGAEATCGIEGATGVVDADELSDEEGKADADGCDKGGYSSKSVSVLVGSEC